MNVELTNLTRNFGRNTAVAGVTLTLGPGVHGLLGPNGAGKTSLLRMLATVLRAPWAWPVRPPADRGAWIAACVVFAAGLLLFTVRGPRTQLADHG